MAVAPRGVGAPYSLNGRVLLDGGVVNPMPFDVARARFGGPVLAVAVNSGAQVFTRQELKLGMTQGPLRPCGRFSYKV